MSQWTLFSNHGHVLLLIAREPEARLRDVAGQVGITERAVQKIIRDLADGGMITIRKRGRRNHYRVIHRKALRHPLESHRNVGDLVNLIHDDLPHSRSPESGVTGAGTGPLGVERDDEPADEPVAWDEVPPVPDEPVDEPETEAAVPGIPAPAPGEMAPAGDAATSAAVAEDVHEPDEPEPEPEPKPARGSRKKKVDESQGSLF